MLYCRFENHWYPLGYQRNSRLRCYWLISTLSPHLRISKSLSCCTMGNSGNFHHLLLWNQLKYSESQRLPSGIPVWLYFVTIMIIHCKLKNVIIGNSAFPFKLKVDICFLGKGPYCNLRIFHMCIKIQNPWQFLPFDSTVNIAYKFASCVVLLPIKMQAPFESRCRPRKV